MNASSPRIAAFPIQGAILPASGAFFSAPGAVLRRVWEGFRAGMAAFWRKGTPPFRAGWSKNAPGWSLASAGWSLASAGCSKNRAGSSLPQAGCPKHAPGSSIPRMGQRPAGFLEHPGAFPDYPAEFLGYPAGFLEHPRAFLGDPAAAMDDPAGAGGLRHFRTGAPEAKTARSGDRETGAERRAFAVPSPSPWPEVSQPQCVLMAWDSGTWDSGFWDSTPAPPSDYFQPKPKPKQNKTMKRQNYYPGRIGDQIAWLLNYAAKLPLHGSTVGVIAGDVTASVNDALWCAYVLGAWLASVRAFSPSTTDAVDEVLTGTGTDAVVLPTFKAPDLPDGVTAAPPGALTRIFALIAKIKLSPHYTESIGTDLGIVGAVAGNTPGTNSTPRFLTELLQGAGHQTVKLTFYKYGYMGVWIESRRGPNGQWEFLAIDTDSPYLDERPLLVAGQPEVREYRMRFWDKGTPNGDWTDVTSVTVSP